MHNLNNPRDVWEEEFEERIDSVDRIMLYCLYSLTNTRVEVEILKRAFNIWIKNEDVDRTKDLFGNSLLRLTESMLRVTEDGKNKYIGVINPSINDYLYYRISNTEMILDTIIENAIYFEQLLKMEIIKPDKINGLIKENIISGKFMKLKGLSRTIEYYLLERIERFNILISDYKDNIHKLILKNNVYKIPNYKFERMNLTEITSHTHLAIRLFKNDKIYEHYAFEELLLNTDNLEIILNFLEYEDVSLLILIYKRIYNHENSNDDFWDDFQKIITDEISYQLEETTISELEEELSEIVSELFDDIDNDIKYDYYHGRDDFLEKIIKEGIELEILDKTKSKIEELGGGFITTPPKVNINEIFEQLNYIDYIHTLMSPDPDDYDDEYPSYSSNSFNDDTEIDSIFIRDYAN